MCGGRRPHSCVDGRGIYFRLINLGKIEFINKPYLLLIYELDNNLTIDEYKFLEAQSQENTEENPNINIDNNELFTNIESLKKIEKIICGTWYTIAESKIFASTLYLFGNKYKRIIKIDYFEKNNIDINRAKRVRNLFMFCQ